MKTLTSSLTQVARNSKKLRGYLASTALTATGLLALASPAMADNWTDLQGGGFSTDINVPNTTNITQHQDIVRATGDLDINEGHTVNIYQPGWDSIFAATDVEGDPTYIRGRLNANGQVIITDNNGVFFTDTSVVNVGSIVASTGNLASTDDDLREGKVKFADVDKGGMIDLQGHITVAEAGLAAFVAPVVKNSGLIEAKMGTIIFAAAPKVTLDLYGDNLVEIAVDDKLGDALLENTGLIQAEGGKVLMTVQTAKDAVDDVINMKGVVDVSSVSVQGGKIILSGGSKGVVNVSGALKADGTSGGKINVTGQNVLLPSTSILSADAGTNGNGGTIRVIGDNAAIVYGRINSRGGAEGGDGGFVEVSGINYLDFLLGNVDTTAANGATGTLLIDPLNILIVGGNGDGHDNSGAAGAGTIGGYQNTGDGGAFTTPTSDGANPYTIYESEIEGQSTSTNIIIQARGSINTQSTAGVNALDNNVTLAANRNLTIETRNNAGDGAGVINLTNLAFTTQGTGSINIHGSTAGNNVSDVTTGVLNSGTGAITVTTGLGSVFLNGAITTQGGALNVTAENEIKLNSGGVQTNGGDVEFTATNRIFLDNDVVTNGGAAKFTATTFTTDDTNPGSNNLDQVLTNGGNVTITADVVNLGETGGAPSAGETVIDAGAGNVTITRKTAGSIAVGSAASGQTQISNQELAAITAGTLNIGDTNAANNKVTAIYLTSVDTTANIAGRVTLSSYLNQAEGVVALMFGAPAVDNNNVYFQSGPNAFNGLTINANDHVMVYNDVSVTSQNGDIILNADANAQGVGALVLGASSLIDSTGDDVVYNGHQVLMAGTINANGGNITLNNDDVFKSFLSNALVTSGTGTITLNQWDKSFVDGGGTGWDSIGSINNAIAALNNTGTGQNTVHVGAGTYVETILADQHNLKLEGNAATVEAPSAGAALVTVTANNVNIDPFVFDGLGITNHGISSDGANGLIVDGNTFQNFLLTNINVSNGSGIRIFGNTMTGAQKGVYANNTADIWVHDNDIIGATVAGVHLVNTDGTNYTNDADIWYNRINSAVNSIGILVEGSDYATIGAHLTNQPNLDDSLNGNVITGGFRGIVVNNSSNAMVRYNDVSNTSSDGVNVFGGSNVKVWDNKIANIGWDGIGFIGSTTGDIKRNTITNVTGASGIAVMGGAHDTVLTDNVITGVDRMGIYVWNSNGVDIVSNNVFDTGREGGNNWFLSGIHLENASNTLIENNVVGKTAGDGIHVGGPGNSPAQATTGNQIIGNRVGYKENVPGSGVFVSAGVNNINGDGVYVMNSDGALIRRNVITETHSSGSEKGSSIQVKNSDDVVITRNTMTNSGWDYIRLDYEGGTLNNLTVTRNTGSGGAERVGIYAERLTNSLIDDNNLSDTTRYAGIYTEGGNNLTITNNRIDDSDEIGILLNNTTGNNFVGYNWITDTGLNKKASDGSNNGDGIRVVNSAGTLASHTTVKGNKVGVFDSAGNINGNGISIIDSAYTEVLSNNVANTVGNGIFIDPSPYSVVAGNWVNNTGDDGIHILDSDFVKVLANFVGTLGGNFNIVGDGIFVENSDNVEVSWNWITNTLSPSNNKGSGVQLYRSDDAVVSHNTIWDTNWDGVRVDESDDVNVSRNEIDDVTRTGIYAEFGDNLTIHRNDIDDVGNDGIYTFTINTVDITNNRVDDAGRYGIHITNGRDAYAADNTITDIDLDGMYISGVRTKLGDTYAVILDDNYVARTGDNGIYVRNLRDAAGVSGNGRILINDNTVWTTGLDGIHVYNSEAGVIGNTVNDTGNKAMGEGIHLDYAKNSNVMFNRVGLLGGNNNINGDAIYLTNSDNGSVMYNLLTNTRSPMINHGSGVQLEDSDNGYVAHNIIWDTGWDGIRLEDSSDAVIYHNHINDVTRTGIYAETASNVTARENDIDDAGRDGIYFWGINNSLIEDNNIGLNGGPNNIGQYGVHVTNGTNTQVLDNDIADVGIDGIIISGTTLGKGGTYAAIVSGNEIDRSGEDGIEMRNVGDSLITDNNVDTSGAVGILISRFNNGRMTVSGNTVNLFDVGMQFESGVIDLTGASNTISNGNTGMLFKPYALGGGAYAPLSLVEDDAVGTSTPFVPGVPPTDYAGTLGAQIFQNIAGQYVELDNFAFWDFVNNVPFWIDARFGDYDGIRPADFPGFVMDPVTYGILEDKLLHFPDGIRDVGIFFFGSVPGDTFDADESQFLRDFDQFSGDITGLNIRILGLPNTGFGGGAGPGGGTTPGALNNIGPFAGGGNNATNPADLNQIETAAGESGTTQQNPANIEPAAGGAEDASCWGDAMNVAQTGQAVSVVYTGSLDDTVTSAANCSGSF